MYLKQAHNFFFVSDGNETDVHVKTALFQNFDDLVHEHIAITKNTKRKLT
jgi:hypothetical protein